MVLGEIAVGAVRHGGRDPFAVRHHADHQHPAAGLPQPTDVLGGRASVAQNQVQQHDVGLLPLPVEEFVHGAGAADETQPRNTGEPGTDSVEQHPVVVHHGDVDHLGHLSSTLTPSPGALSTVA